VPKSTDPSWTLTLSVQHSKKSLKAVYEFTSVTGLSLHTNSTFSGGFNSASGISPICKVHLTLTNVKMLISAASKQLLLQMQILPIAPSAQSHTRGQWQISRKGKPREVSSLMNSVRGDTFQCQEMWSSHQLGRYRDSRNEVPYHFQDHST